MSIVPRTCTEIRTTDAIASAERAQANAGRPLECFRTTPAYVLLGDPGAGKTKAFKRECEAMGAAACFVTARNFLTFKPANRPEWRGKTLFIDGLDERRAGSPDKLAPLDQIRGRLAELGTPCFRLSCRTADWLGHNDGRHLTAVAPDSAPIIILRLDPLTDSDARKILEARPDIPNASAFIRTATDRGVDSLLRNPQSLGLLAGVVASSGTWPKTRLETFDRAIRHLVDEHNREHRHAARVPALDCALDAAGGLCAILILTGRAGYALDLDYAGDDYLDPDWCTFNRNAVRQALSTKLFTAETEGHFTPVHRHLAEFLAARHLARLIASGSGLPRGRVLALIAGDDGTVVTSFRGLSAWLAVLCPDVRADLIERDPIGVVSYGDVSGFTTAEKHMLLVALSREASRLRSVTWAPEAVGALATEDMGSVLRDALASPTEEPYYAAWVLLALTHGTPLPGLADFLLEMVYRGHRWLQLPRMVLNAFIHNCSDQTKRDQALVQLLAGLTTGRVTDWNNELLGTLLTKLYPRRLTPAKIWDYLSVTAQRFVSGPFHHFWQVQLVETSSAIPELLDSLAARRGELKHAFESYHLQAVPLKLLARGIEGYGDTLGVKHLCDWLTVDMFPDLHGMATEAVGRIQSWLQQRPATLKAIIAEVAGRPLGPMDTAQSRVDEIRYGAELPPDYGLWCLEQAAVCTDDRWSRHFLYSCCHSIAYQIHDRGLTLELVFERTKGSTQLRRELDGLLMCPVRLPDRPEERRSAREDRERNHASWIAYVRSHMADLRSGQCSLDVLYQVGKAYFGSLMEAHGGSPRERIRTLFHNEVPLIEAAYSGMLRTLSRNDVPTPDEIIDLIGSGQEYKHGLPFLAGMEELETGAVRHLNDKQVRQALAFRYSAPALRSELPHSEWYRTVLDRCPETVAEALVRYVATVLRAGRHDDSFVPQLLMEDHAGVACHAAMPLLRGFPLRATIPQLRNLDHLLQAAYRHADRQCFLDLIAERLSRSSMTVAQRVHWLAMGVVVCQNRYLGPLKDVLKRREGRISHLAEFLLRAGPTIDELTVPALKYYISLLGSTLGRWISHDSDLMAVESAGVAPCVFQMIQRLAMLPDSEASAALDELAADAALSSWNLNLVTARDRQRVVRRDAVYCHPTVDHLCRVLHDGPLATLPQRSSGQANA